LNLKVQSKIINSSISVLQRNHTLFGSVWSSMRKQKPFSRNRILKSSNNNNNNTMNNNTMSLATNAVHNMAKTVALPGNYLENDYSHSDSYVQRERLTDGLNSITKSILQQRGVNSQLEQHDDIPLRPLLLNGSQNQGNPINDFQGQNNE
jgi:hypothetical protein